MGVGGLDAAEGVSDMRTLIYVSSEYNRPPGRLFYHWHSGGPVIALPAVSGPYGAGSAPQGMYEVRQPVALKAEGNQPYQDVDGFCWFAKIMPQFHTERTGLGIHPDGNVPGTLGCIGLKGSTRSFYEWLKGEILAGEPVMLYVC